MPAWCQHPPTRGVAAENPQATARRPRAQKEGQRQTGPGACRGGRRYAGRSCRWTPEAGREPQASLLQQGPVNGVPAGKTATGPVWTRPPAAAPGGRRLEPEPRPRRRVRPHGAAEQPSDGRPSRPRPTEITLPPLCSTRQPPPPHTHPCPTRRPCAVCCRPTRALHPPQLTHNK